MLNKSINKIKLALTNACNLDCPYCFVDQAKDMMGDRVARASIDLLLESPGKDKLLSLYGGEPLLNFSLIRKIVPYAKKKAVRLKKDLTVNICTNFLLANEEIVSFLKKNEVKVVVTFWGGKNDHDRMRRTHRGSGSYDLVLDLLSRLWGDPLPQEMGVSFCIAPFSVRRIRENWLDLYALGFRHFNVEIIRGFGCWTKDRAAAFLSGMSAVAREVFCRAARGESVYLNPVNWEMKYRLLSVPERSLCPFSYDLEIYPRGQMAFSPFLLNLRNADDYIIGRVDKGLKRFKGCSFNGDLLRCRECKCEYFKTAGFDRAASTVFVLNRVVSLELARTIQMHYKIMEKYILSIKKDVCF